MQKKRVVITLDPDYIPWEHNDDVVRLRRKRLKIPRGLLLAIGVVGAFTMAIIGQNIQRRQQSDDAVVEATAPAPVVDAFAGYCEFNGLLLPPGTHYIGEVARECADGVLR